VRIELHNASLNVAGGSGLSGRFNMQEIFCRLWSEDKAQDIAEYAVMLAVILVIVVGTIRLIGNNANNVFSSVASSISQ
jgi:Flp pilus assembly pilin Flp